MRRTAGCMRRKSGITAAKKMIEEREIKTKENTCLTIGEYTLNGNFIYIPIISLNDSIGLIIMYNESPLKDELIIGKLVASIFSQKLDI